MTRLVPLFAALFACTTFHGVTVTQPSQGNPNYTPAADSVQPTLRWEPVEGATYDLIVFLGVGHDRDFWNKEEYVPGSRVYYREGLAAAEHRLEQPLEYDTRYFFSVRTRKDGKVSAWSRYDWTMFAVVAYSFARNVPFTFRTPKKDVPAATTQGN